MRGILWSLAALPTESFFVVVGIGINEIEAYSRLTRSQHVNKSEKLKHRLSSPKIYETTPVDL